MRVGLDHFPFHLHPETLGVAVALVAGYWYGVTRLARRHTPRGETAVTRRQVAWFGLAIVLFLVVEGWPVHDVAEGSLFSFHMAEHMVLSFVFPPALLLGIPWWLMRLVVRPLLPAIRFLTRPLVALVLFNAVLAGLHAPGVVAGMLGSEAFHLGAHLALVVTAILMWWPVIGPIPDTPALAPPLAIGYLFLQSLVPTIPASFLTFASGPVYPAYAELPRLWGLPVLTDQLIAGLIMKVGGGLFLWTLIAIIWFRWAGEEEGADRAGRALTGS